jgi:hypothetical protein
MQKTERRSVTAAYEKRGLHSLLYLSVKKGLTVPFLSMLGRLADALNITVRDMIERIVYRYARKGVLIRHYG